MPTVEREYLRGGRAHVGAVSARCWSRLLGERRTRYCRSKTPGAVRELDSPPPPPPLECARARNFASIPLDLAAPSRSLRFAPAYALSLFLCLARALARPRAPLLMRLRPPPHRESVGDSPTARDEDLPSPSTRGNLPNPDVRGCKLVTYAMGPRYLSPRILPQRRQSFF